MMVFLRLDLVTTGWGPSLLPACVTWGHAMAWCSCLYVLLP